MGCPQTLALALCLAAPARPELTEQEELAPDLIVAQEGESGASPIASSEQVARENWRMVVAGDVLIGAGMGGFAVMVAGLAVQSRGSQELDRLALRDDVTQADRDEAQAQRDLGLRLAIAGASTTVALLTTGITLVAVGNRRERKRREAQRATAWGSGPSGWMVPTRSKRSVGLSWSWRF
jgi:hypothetical protein